LHDAIASPPCRADDFLMRLFERPGPARAGVAAVLALLFVLHLALFAFATLVTDSGRDLANAWAIGHGGPYPEYGPSLFGRWKLGPVWFYALALPLRVFGSVTAAALFTGALAALKIPLAFLVGRRLVDARLGLLAALAISLPGWGSVGTLVIAHTSAVETGVLATIWLALVAWQDRRPAFFALACLALALALHAHPTALVAAPALLPALWQALRTPGARRWILVGSALFALPFLPALLAEMRAGWPQATASLNYMQEADPIARLARVPAVAWALVAGGAGFGGRFLLSVPAALVWMLHGLALLAAASGAIRLLRVGPQDETARRARRGLLLLAAGAPCAIAFIALLRDATPTWMTYALAPFGAGLLALGAWGLIHDRVRRDAALGALALLVAGTGALGLSQRAALESTGRILLPSGRIGDITASGAAAQYSPWLSVRQFDALAARSCAGTEPLALHGELAAVFDFSQGVAARLHCPSDRLPTLGGSAGARHLAGVAMGVASDLGLVPTPVAHGYVLRTPLRVLTEQARVAEVDVRYRPERQAAFDAAGDQVLEGRAPCPPDALLAITNLTPMVNRARFEVWIDGDPVVPLADTRLTRYYACSGGELAWRVHTPDPASIDAVLLSRGAR
jgi:hypothetical protein